MEGGVLRGDPREPGTGGVNAQPMRWCNVERSSPLVAGHDKALSVCTTTSAF